MVKRDNPTMSTASDSAMAQSSGMPSRRGCRAATPSLRSLAQADEEQGDVQDFVELIQSLHTSLTPHESRSGISRRICAPICLMGGRVSRDACGRCRRGFLSRRSWRFSPVAFCLCCGEYLALRRRPTSRKKRWPRRYRRSRPIASALHSESDSSPVSTHGSESCLVTPGIRADILSPGRSISGES